ncbi:MAG: RecX family transcriptional regulator [Burkholderiales bacterium]|nr:RecX family transcriptional regulator [Burkholderiales bacterium]
MSRSPRESAAALRRRALALLARREHSRAELAARLAPEAASPAALAALLDELERGGLLSDERYAEVRARRLARKYGAARIREDLRAKGVPAPIVERFAAGDELARARAILARRYRGQAATREERARRARFLLGRGFSRETVRRALALAAEETD